MLAGGSAIVIAFLVGAMTGRFVQPDRSPEFVVATPLPISESTAPTPAPTVAPAATAVPSNAPPPAPVPPARRSPAAFNAKTAKAAIDGVTPRLRTCRHAGDPAGPVTVMVTFDPAGRVSNATVTTAGHAGTRTGDCIVQRLRELRIPEFSGAAVTVKRSVAFR
jgi:hypothetical protein